MWGWNKSHATNLQTPLYTRDPTKEPCVRIIFILKSWFVCTGVHYAEGTDPSQLPYVMHTVSVCIETKLLIGRAKDGGGCANSSYFNTMGKGLFTMIGSLPMWQIKREVSLVFQDHANYLTYHMEGWTSGPHQWTYLYVLFKFGVQVWSSTPHIMCLTW